jgi:hypothetical protein
LLDQIFADRDVIEPDGPLWSSYVQCLEEPLATLFDLKLAIFVLYEVKDLLLKEAFGHKPQKPYIDDWRVQHFFVVPGMVVFGSGTMQNSIALMAAALRRRTICSNLLSVAVNRGYTSPPTLWWSLSLRDQLV